MPENQQKNPVEMRIDRPTIQVTVMEPVFPNTARLVLALVNEDGEVIRDWSAMLEIGESFTVAFKRIFIDVIVSN